MTTGFDPAVLGQALGTRLAQVAAAAERYDAFVFTPGGDEATVPEAGEILAVARDLVGRALSAAGDPLNAAMLRRLAEGDASLGALGALVRLPRLAVWERLNELVATGLVGRALEGDGAGLTPAGAALVELCEAVAQAAATEAAATRAGSP